MQRQLYIDEAHTALDVFSFVVFLGDMLPQYMALSVCYVCVCYLSYNFPYNNKNNNSIKIMLELALEILRVATCPVKMRIC